MNDTLLSSKELIALSKKNQSLISELKQVREELRLENHNQSSNIRSRYYDKIKKLEMQERKILSNLEDKMHKINKNYDDKISELSKPIDQLKRIIYFYNQSKTTLNFDATKTTNRNRYLELIGQYRELPNLHLALYIAENDRPKFKYSLIIVGMCRFGDHTRESKILKLPYDYGCNLHHSDIQWFDIAKIIKHFDSIESAKKYHKSHKIDQILNSFLAEYVKIDQEWYDILRTYTTEDFTEILKQGDGLD